jgi:nitrate reductase gamma subunit
MQGTILYLFTYLSLAVFLIGLIYRAVKIARMPVHLRWELAPVPHEKGKGAYGGSYLEEFEWWKKKREKSLIAEAWYMFQEIALLKGVFENKRPLWFLSFPFHFGGIYIPAGMTGLIFVGAVLQTAGLPLLILPKVITVLALLGYVLGTVGVLGLLFRRIFDSELRPFTTAAAVFNLIFLLAIYATGLNALASLDGFSFIMIGFVKSLFPFNAGIILPGAALLHIVLALLFLVYLPFTYMMHFVAKYFTYHEVRWNDEPMTAGSKMEKQVQSLLGQKVTWAAPHIRGEGKKNWVDIATEEVKDEKSK